MSVLKILRWKCMLGCFACCPLVSHVQYALRAMLRLEIGRSIGPVNIE